VSPDPTAPLHARREVPTPVRVLLVLLFLYGFLVGVGLLESGIAALGEGFQEGMLENVVNPISGLFAGILATVLVQSSSVSTSTIVALVGAGQLPVSLAVPMIMGANIGTTVTNTLASLGAIRRVEEFRRGFAAATMHDFFNLIAVAVLLPLELATGFLSGSAEWLTERLRGQQVSEIGRSPIRTAVKYPIGLVEQLLDRDHVGGVVVGLLFLAIGLALVFLALTYVTRNMRLLVAGGMQRAMNRVIGRGGGVIGIVIGVVITVAVQSSSITTSILVPLVAAGLLSLPNAFPITLGANVGTTVTALLASLAVVRPEGLTIALVHTLFNVTGLLLLYPVPAVRMVPVRLAEGLAEVAVVHRSVVVAYILGLFLVVPLVGIFLIP
jgi:solute carrier family 34 (sodium-dependent phosphate cotransporter)